MTLYADASYPVPAALDALHADELHSFARPGTWGSAAQRTAVAATARRARCEAGVQESVGDESLAESVDLPQAVKRVTRAVALGAMDIDRAFCQQALADGVTEGAYVEIVSVVARLANLDIFARGIGVPSRKLDEPIDDRPPSFERPPEAVDDGFYAATVPNPPEGGALAESLYGKKPTANILRAVSLVPAEARRVIALGATQYVPPKLFMDFTSSGTHALSRSQVEIVAAKVSEHNRCFY